MQTHQQSVNTQAPVRKDWGGAGKKDLLEEQLQKSQHWYKAAPWCKGYSLDNQDD